MSLLPPKTTRTQMRLERKIRSLETRVSELQCQLEELYKAIYGEEGKTVQPPRYGGWPPSR